MPEGEAYSFERGLFPTLLEKKERVLSYILDGYWIDIGTPQKYLEVHHDILAEKFVQNECLREPGLQPLQPTLSVDEKSIIDSDVTIRAGATSRIPSSAATAKLENRLTCRFRDLAGQYDRRRSTS